MVGRTRRAVGRHADVIRARGEVLRRCVGRGSPRAVDLRAPATTCVGIRDERHSRTVDEGQRRIDSVRFTRFGCVTFDRFNAQRSTLRNREREPIGIRENLMRTVDLRHVPVVGICLSLHIVGLRFAHVVHVEQRAQEVVWHGRTSDVVDLDVIRSRLKQDGKFRTIANTCGERVLLERHSDAVEQRQSRRDHPDAISAARIERLERNDRICRGHDHLEDVLVRRRKGASDVERAIDGEIGIGFGRRAVGLDFRDLFPLTHAVAAIVRRGISVVA